MSETKRTESNEPEPIPRPASYGPSPFLPAQYSVNVDGVNYNVVVAPMGTVVVAPAALAQIHKPPAAAPYAQIPRAPVSGGPVFVQASPAVQTTVTAASAPLPVGGKAILPSPVAGTVIRYSVQDGATVNAGDTVLILESMKMELDIKASSTGKIRFMAAPGTPVVAQQPLAEITGDASVQPAAAAAPAPAAPVSAPVAATPAAPPPAASAPPPVVSAAPPAGKGILPAPVAGSVIRYAVNEGAEVKQGDTVLILESMKMELEIKANASGKIHFLVSAGAQVTSQQPIAEIG